MFYKVVEGWCMVISSKSLFVSTKGGPVQSKTDNVFLLEYEEPFAQGSM